MTDSPNPFPVTPPWMLPTCFGYAPSESYGYLSDGVAKSCSQDELITTISKDSSKKIRLVWSPETASKVALEELPFLFNAIVARQKSNLRRGNILPMFHILFWGGFGLLAYVQSLVVSQFLLFNLMAWGVIPLFENVWELRRMHNYTPEKMQRDIPEARYMVWITEQKSRWMWGIWACILVIGLAQVLGGVDHTVAAAGIVKPAIWHGEIWRLATGTLLHASFLHFMFNSLALLAMSKLIDVLLHRAYIPIVFLIAALVGSIFSLLFLPDKTSVGASGGIMGLLGFLVVFGYYRQHLLPTGFVRSLLTSIAFIVALGLMAYDLIDNAAHLGGLLAGVILGIAFIRQNRSLSIPAQVPGTIEIAGVLAGTALVGITLIALQAFIT